jgi:hypothetical protein
MGEAKPFENTTISAPRWAPVRVRNMDSGGERGRHEGDLIVFNHMHRSLKVLA